MTRSTVRRDVPATEPATVSAAASVNRPHVGGFPCALGFYRFVLDPRAFLSFISVFSFLMSKSSVTD